MNSKLLRIHGKVQGVYYRDNAVAQAGELGVTGWVRNRHDGTVEALVCGATEAVEAFINWAHSGPADARVDKIELTDGSQHGMPLAFERWPTR
ncbi:MULTISPECIES: acylphosphatase [Microvirgula]|uniref:acylphosphatase n=1 Tax=Microvirgula aerodenitrificans TaxID=57480 RepID=A0A2S0PBM9_9NEIS|nr:MULTISPECIES: acylphosphatase [Microvirgula]AVY94723.1 acylphosphatase [Microvirgula aerodenitrificans]RAS17094.1 acylphosphatase [Microvirgula sp. AG722]